MQFPLSCQYLRLRIYILGLYQYFCMSCKNKPKRNLPECNFSSSVSTCRPQNSYSWPIKLFLNLILLYQIISEILATDLARFKLVCLLKIVLESSGKSSPLYTEFPGSCCRPTWQVYTFLLLFTVKKRLQGVMGPIIKLRVMGMEVVSKARGGGGW